MMLWILVAALLAQFGSSLPIASSVVDVANLDNAANPPSQAPSNFTDRLDFISHNSTVSPRGRIVKRTTWPLDPAGVDPNDPNTLTKIINLDNYNCNKFASLHNRIPPYLMAGLPPVNGQTDPRLETYQLRKQLPACMSIH
ncbi:hypothetical protein PG994_014106 [Apiospora phragmitis]|uniref:Uncharacterized protein n=1 Tax=Apiospora phragmitis TaxID=2905665 RepID=A0ABR1T3E8_9PEZI